MVSDRDGFEFGELPQYGRGRRPPKRQFGAFVLALLFLISLVVVWRSTTGGESATAVLAEQGDGRVGGDPREDPRGALRNVARAPLGLVRLDDVGKRVLVTGLGTFWGGRVAQALEHEPDVEVIVGLDREEPMVELERTEYVRSDENYSILSRIVRATKVDTIVHTFLVVDSTTMSSRTMHEINVIGTMQKIADVIAKTGCPFAGAGIIGPPPKPGSTNTRIYVSGPSAKDVAQLNDFGLIVRILEGPLTAASALKMSYAGITKGFTALGTAMMLAASRGGSAEALKVELAESRPDLLRYLSNQVPSMYSKAYRWVAELDEIAAFVGEEFPERDMLQAAARLYERIAEDFEDRKDEIGKLDRFLDRS